MTDQPLLQLRQLEEANRQLQEAVQAKTSLLLSLSHELRAPLHCILASSAVLLEPNASAGQVRENGETIKVCGEHMLELVNDVLDIEKMEANKMTLESICFRPTDEADTVLRIFNAQAEQKNIKLVRELNLTHPARLGDPLRFRQVLFNLLSNAIKFTDKGGQVVVRMVDNSEDIQIEVEDNGPGISQERLCTLFENFNQGDCSIARRYGGSGLGLTLSKQICERMGGQLHCTSSLGKGTKFWFTMCLPIQSADTMTFHARKDSTTEPSDELPKKKILLVDDDPINRKVGGRMLHSLKCHVETAANGEECLAAMKKEPFDLVLMDCKMPVMDGFCATRILREREQQATTTGQPVHVPVVAVPATTTDEFRQKCINAGMDDWMPKPFDKDMLCRVLNRWLGDPNYEEKEKTRNNQIHGPTLRRTTGTA